MGQIAVKGPRRTYPIIKPAEDMPDLPEYEAKAQMFGALSGMASVIGRGLQDKRTQSEFTEGKALWTERHDEFVRGLRDDPDYKSYLGKYDKFNAGLQRELFGKGYTSQATNGLKNYMVDKTADQRKLVAGISVNKEVDYFRASTLAAVNTHVLAGEAAAAKSALIRGRDSGYFSAEEIEKKLQNIDVETDLNLGLQSLQVAPERFLKEIEDKDFLPNLDTELRLRLKNQAKAVMAQGQREQAAQLKEMRERTMSTMLTDVWDGKLTDLQAVTDAFRAGYLDDTDAKYLHNAIMSPDPPENTNEALIAVRYAIDGIGVTETRESALKVVTQYVKQLDPDTGKAFIKEIFGEHDTKNAFWNRQAQEYMERQIMEVASLTGILYGSGEQLALSAQALMSYDEAKKAAITEEKPLNGRELLVLAHEIMLPFRKQVKPLMEGEKLPRTIEQEPKIKPKTLSKEQREKMARGIQEALIGGFTGRPKAKLTRKAPRNNPQFIIKDGKPEMEFDAKGKEIGLKIKDGTVLKIGYHYRIGYKVWEYLGNGRAKPVK